MCRGMRRRPLSVPGRLLGRVPAAAVDWTRRHTRRLSKQWLVQRTAGPQEPIHGLAKPLLDRPRGVLDLLLLSQPGIFEGLRQRLSLLREVVHAAPGPFFQAQARAVEAVEATGHDRGADGSHTAGIRRPPAIAVRAHQQLPLAEGRGAAHEEAAQGPNVNIDSFAQASAGSMLQPCQHRRQTAQHECQQVRQHGEYPEHVERDFRHDGRGQIHAPLRQRLRVHLHAEGGILFLVRVIGLGAKVRVQQIHEAHWLARPRAAQQTRRACEVNRGDHDHRDGRQADASGRAWDVHLDALPQVWTSAQPPRVPCHDEQRTGASEEHHPEDTQRLGGAIEADGEASVPAHGRAANLSGLPSDLNLYAPGGRHLAQQLAELHVGPLAGQQLLIRQLQNASDREVLQAGAEVEIGLPEEGVLLVFVVVPHLYVQVQVVHPLQQ
mmetsp:Transcript_80866/g.232343  ORF Transcript_80866/g.232343 Transcript_80866/m.232343 type:complete len:437 (-) Transcript_80866:415-1725(-)